MLTIPCLSAIRIVGIAGAGVGVGLNTGGAVLVAGGTGAVVLAT